MDVYGGGFLPLTGGTLTGNLTLPAAGALLFLGQSQVQSPSDGVLTLLNNAGTGFTRLQFGGTTSAFPALKRSGATLAFRLADDSGDADGTMKSLQTGSVGGLAGGWKFGGLVTAAVAADTTRYLSVDVSGVVYKIIIST